jgi:site-specific DNA-adenine methylase
MPTTPHPRQSYPGGKAGAGVAQRLINLMPTHAVYIEPFLGHGAVLLHKRP